MLPDRLFYPLALLAALALIALALIWPQGQGAPSPLASPAGLRTLQAPQ